MIAKRSVLFCIFISVIILGAVLAAPLKAQFSDDIDITFTPAQEELTVGDLVELTLSVTHPEGYTVVFPPLPEVWDEYEVRVQNEPETVSNGDGSETTSQVIVVTLFAPGIHQTPGIHLTLRDNENQVIERVAPQLSLNVIPVLSPDDSALRDIKPQAELGLVLPLLWIGAGILAAILSLVIIWWAIAWLRKKLAREPEIFVPAPVIDTRPAYIIAYEELDRIERLDLPGQGRFKEYYSLVTDCLRVYLGGMYSIPAIDLTTTETRQALNQSILAGDHAQEFVALFSEGDLVKFARFVPPRAEAQKAIGRARGLVDLTKIIEQPDDEEDEDSASPIEAEMVTQEAM
jgi:hypothetical protein